MKTNIQRLYQTIKRPLTVKLFFPSLFLLFSFRPYEDNCLPDLPVIRKELKVERTFEHIHIEGDISLVLTNDPAGTIIIEGKEKELKKIRPVFEKNVLIIDANRKQLFAKLTIYLSAITLQTIQLNGDGNISSIAFIQSEYLHISLNGNIKVKVKTMGQISFDTPDDIELQLTPPVMVMEN
jgi:Putative auto-transporter adhesin, head GIN domain